MLEEIDKLLSTYGANADNNVWARRRRDMPHMYDVDSWMRHFEVLRFESLHPQPLKVLDYGCGPGQPAIALCRKGYTVTGYDPNALAIAIARLVLGHESPEVQSRVGFTRVLNTLNTREYEVAWCSHVLEHVPREDWVDVYKNLRALKVPTVFVSVPARGTYSDPTDINRWDTLEAFLEDLCIFGEVTRSEDDKEHDVFHVEVQIEKGSEYNPSQGYAEEGDNSRQHESGAKGNVLG